MSMTTNKSIRTEIKTSETSERHGSSICLTVDDAGAATLELSGGEAGVGRDINAERYASVRIDFRHVEKLIVDAKIWLENNKPKVSRLSANQQD